MLAVLAMLALKWALRVAWAAPLLPSPPLRAASLPLSGRDVLPPVDWTHGRRYGDGSGYAFPDQTDIASVLGSVKHKPLTRRPSALLDRPYARWLGIAQVGTTGSAAFRSNNRIVHAAIAEVAAN